MDTIEKAAELVSIIECNAGEPDAIVRALAPVYRQAEDAKDSCREILWYMIRAAFNVSAAHRLALDEYLAAIEQGREPSEEVRARLATQQQPVEAEPETFCGSGVLLEGGEGETFFRIDFADNRNVKSIKFQVLDEAGAVVRSILVMVKNPDSKAKDPS